jgi:hypothetical protein
MVEDISDLRIRPSEELKEIWVEGFVNSAEVQSVERNAADIDDDCAREHSPGNIPYSGST